MIETVLILRTRTIFRRLRISRNNARRRKIQVTSNVRWICKSCLTLWEMCQRRRQKTGKISVSGIGIAFVWEIFLIPFLSASVCNCICRSMYTCSVYALPFENLEHEENKWVKYFKILVTVFRFNSIRYYIISSMIEPESKNYH